MADSRRYVRTVAAARCRDWGSDRKLDHPRRGLVCGDCGATWPRYQVGP